MKERHVSYRTRTRLIALGGGLVLLPSVPAFAFESCAYLSTGYHKADIKESRACRQEKPTCNHEKIAELKSQENEDGTAALQSGFLVCLGGMMVWRALYRRGHQPTPTDITVAGSIAPEMLQAGQLPAMTLDEELQAVIDHRFPLSADPEAREPKMRHKPGNI